MYRLALLIGAILLHTSVFAQSIAFLNGDFENVTGTGCQYNLADTTFNKRMANVTAFGKATFSGHPQGQTDIMTQGCFGNPQQGAWKIGIAVSVEDLSADAVALELNQPLVAGEQYQLSFYANPNVNGSRQLGDVEIGQSTVDTLFGTSIQTVTPVPGSWTLLSINFIAGPATNFITVRNSAPHNCWNHLDNFSISEVCGTSSQLTVSACDSFASPSGNRIWTTSGVHTDTLLNAVGCDSVIFVDLTINTTTSSNISAIACSDFVSPSGNHIWDSTGTYTDTLINSAGCDSLVVVDLQLLESDTSYSVVACNKYTPPSGGPDWTTSGVYTDSIPNAIGCDSIITIDLQLLKSDTVFSAEVCQGFERPTGPPITISGSYVYILTNVHGCDSVIYLNLTVNGGDTAVSVFGDSLYSAATGAGYQWIYCDSVAITGANGASFRASTDGQYAVVLEKNGCIDTSACVEVLGIGLSDTPWEEIELFPNPMNGKTSLRWNHLPEAGLKLYDAHGRLLWEKTEITTIMLTIELPNTPGVYFLEVERNGSRRMMKLVRE